MNPDQKHKTANWKYTALSSSDVSPEILSTNTCEKSPLLQNMENDAIATRRAADGQTDSVKIHRKVDTNKHSSGEIRGSGDMVRGGSDISKQSILVETSRNDFSNGNTERNGARPKASREAIKETSESSNGDKDPANQLDIVRKMSEMSLQGDKAWQVVGQYGTLKMKRCQRLYATSGRADDLALFHVNGKFSAMEAWCTHMGGPLFDGDIENYNGRCHVMCPWHSYMFDLENGKNEIGLQQKVYEMKYANGYVYVLYHTELSTVPIRKPSAPAEPKPEGVARKTSVLESPIKL